MELLELQFFSEKEKIDSSDIWTINHWIFNQMLDLCLVDHRVIWCSLETIIVQYKSTAIGTLVSYRCFFLVREIRWSSWSKTDLDLFVDKRNRTSQSVTTFHMEQSNKTTDTLPGCWRHNYIRRCIYSYVMLSCSLLKLVKIGCQFEKFCLISFSTKSLI